MKEYALYKGDTFVMIGTANELAEYLNVKRQTVEFYKTPTYRKRTDGRGIVVIEVSDDLEEK